LSVPTEKPAQQQRLPLESRPLIHPEATVWRVLDRDHRGRERAIKMPDLADKVGLKTRALQGLIRHLRMEHGKPIGSSCREPYGRKVRCYRRKVRRQADGQGGHPPQD